jgi:hypothetical protein
MGHSTSSIVVEDTSSPAAGYTIYCNHSGAGTNNRLHNNRFSRVLVNTVGGFGPWAECLDENIVGNVYHETGQLLPGQ